MIFVWMVVCIAGNVMAGHGNTFVATTLTVAIDETDTTITVASTEGFPTTGFINIGDERIGYADTTATTFIGTAASPIIRGQGGSEAEAHAVGAIVRTVENYMMNASIDYKIATITDASGVMAFITLPFKLLGLLVTFFTLPLSFFGTDLAMIGYIWAALSIGMFVSFGIAVIGGRRV